MGELSPGSTPRRWVPEGGERKLREKIHRESKFADDHKKLPFTFSKPSRRTRDTMFKCVECGRILSAPINTIMCSCPVCEKATRVERINDE